MAGRLLAGLLLMVCMTVQAAPLRVAVASNFRAVAEELARNFTRDTGHQVTVSTGATGTLYNQITHGAPFDLFLSADSKRPGMLAEQGFTVGEPRTYAYGRLVFWQPGGQPGYKTLTGWQGRLAVANPQTAPYGAAAAEVLRHYQLTPPQIELVQGANIQQTWQFVATGNVKAGFVALSQLQADQVDSGYLLLDEKLYTPIRQDAVVIAGRRNAGLARQFLDYLLAPAQQARVQASGYYPVTPRNNKYRSSNNG